MLSVLLGISVLLGDPLDLGSVDKGAILKVDLLPVQFRRVDLEALDSSHWSSTLEHIVLLIVSDNSQSSSVGLGAEDLLNCLLILILEYNNRQLSASRVASGPESASFLVVLTNGIEGVLKPVLEVILILLPDLSPYLKGRSLLTVTEVVEEPKRDIVRNVVVDVVLSQEELL